MVLREPFSISLGAMDEDAEASAAGAAQQSASGPMTTEDAEETQANGRKKEGRRSQIEGLDRVSPCREG